MNPTDPGSPRYDLTGLPDEELDRFLTEPDEAANQFLSELSEPEDVGGRPPRTP